MSRKQALIALICVICVGVMLRAYRMGDRSIWYDEAFSYVLIHECTWKRMFHSLQQDVHPPCYFVALRIWANCFGTSIYSLRGFSVAMGGITILGIYLFTRDVVVTGSRSKGDEAAIKGGRAAGVSAAALLAVFSAHIWWSQDAKMYSLATALISFNAWFLVRALSTPNAKPWWAIYAITSAAMLYTHNYALFTFAGEGVFLGIYFAFQAGCSPARLWASMSFRQACVALAAAGCIYLPWVPTLLTQARRVRSDYWIPPADAWSAAYALDLLFFPENDFRVPPYRAMTLIAVLGVMLFWIVCQRRVIHWLPCTLVLTPILCAVLVSLGFASIITPRYFLFASLFVPTVAVLIVWYTIPRYCWCVVAILVLNLFGLHAYFMQSLYLDDQGTRGVMAHLLQNRHPEEPVVVAHAGVFYPIKYYADALFGAKLLMSSETLPHYLGGAILVRSDTIRASELCDGSSDTVWVVDSTGFGTVPAARSKIPDTWKPVSGSHVSFREVFGWQGVVTAEQYRCR
jgi:mannosyltransferase